MPVPGARWLPALLRPETTTVAEDQRALILMEAARCVLSETQTFFSSSFFWGGGMMDSASSSTMAVGERGIRREKTHCGGTRAAGAGEVPNANYCCVDYCPHRRIPAGWVGSDETRAGKARQDKKQPAGGEEEEERRRRDLDLDLEPWPWTAGAAAVV